MKWIIDKTENNFCVNICVRDEKLNKIVEMPFTKDAENNAKLIAAAPELLELVLVMKADFTDLHYQKRLTDNGEITYQKILDVIKKLTE